jgi:hypothetical protein
LYMDTKVDTKGVECFGILFPSIVRLKIAKKMTILYLCFCLGFFEFAKTLIFSFYKIYPYSSTKIINKGDEVLKASHRCSVEWSTYI